jgi:hypothetical protein
VPIRSLQLRLTQVGVIRLGEQRISAKTGKPYPAKLETFRITSPSRDIVTKAAELYGGEVRDWPDGPSGPEFQVITKTNALPVFVLPQRIDPNLELWGKGHRQRLCDGETERIRNVPCLCEAAARLRYERSRRPWPEDGKFIRDPRSDCKPTTRLSVMLADLSDGQWKVEAHGWNAAAELPTKATVYLALAQKPVPATLRLVIRKDAVLKVQPNGSEEIESREYAVPVLDFGDLFTARVALTGGVDAAAQAALGGTQRPAITATAEPPTDWLAEIAAAQSASDLNDLRTRMVQAGVKDPALVEAWKARGAAIVAAAEQPPAAQANGAAPAAVEVVEGEPEPNPDETWAAILREAGKHGWKTSQVEKAFAERVGVDASEASGWQLAAFLTALTAGEVSS